MNSTFAPVFLRSLAVGTPPHITPQSQIREAATQLFPRLAQRKSLFDVFENAQIDTRALAMPLEWYLQPRSFAEKNAVYVRSALELSERLSREALEQAGLRPQDIDGVVFVSSTGISTPSLDSALMQRLGISPQAARLPLWGLGCAGGAAGLSRSADLLRAGRRNVLLVTAELCSLTLVQGNESGSNFVGTALFADGGSAAVLSSEAAPHAARLLGAYSTLIPNSADVMGWDVTDDGLQVRFSRDIPALVLDMMKDNVREATASVGWQPQDIQHYAVHPGGVKVIAAYEQALNLPTGTLNLSRGVLRRYGNMSSPTVLFVLRELLDQQPMGKTLLSAMGPGFCAEHALLELA